MSELTPAERLTATANAVRSGLANLTDDELDELADVFDAAAAAFNGSLGYRYTSTLVYRVLALAELLDYEPRGGERR